MALACKPPLWAKADAPVYGWCAGTDTLHASATNWDTLVSSRRFSGPTVTRPIFNSRSAMTVSRSVLPTRSPKPFTVPCTWVTPARTAASVFATAHPESLWQWMPSC